MNLPTAWKQFRNAQKRSFVICYRREDAEPDANLLYDSLTREFGEKEVFLDIRANVDKLPPGKPFSEVIADQIKSSYALLVMIGKTWLSIRGDTGQQRLFEPNDEVRKEIEVALERGKKEQKAEEQVIPILLPQASWPREEELPISIKKLSSLHAHGLDNRHYDQDVGKLITSLKNIRKEIRHQDWLNLPKSFRLVLLIAPVLLIAMTFIIAVNTVPLILTMKPPSVRYQPVVQDLFNAGKYEEAANTLRVWIQEDPNNKSAEFFFSRVRELIQKCKNLDLSIKVKDYSGARAALDRLQELNKADPNNVNRQARLDEIFAPEFQDEFLGGMDDWVAPSTWRVDHGSLVVRGIGLGFIKEKHYRNFAATFNLSFLNNKGAVWILRAEGLSRYYLFQLTGSQGNPPNSFSGFRFYNDKRESILKPIVVGANLGIKDDQFTLKVEVAGDRIKHYISLVSAPTLEPILLGAVNDPLIQEGTLGFGVNNGEEFAVRALKIVPIGAAPPTNIP
jgi:hypothetical protein